MAALARGAFVSSSSEDEDEEPPLLVAFAEDCRVTAASPAVTPAAPKAGLGATARRAGPGGTSSWDETQRKVPVTILCGFLGSGKTTLLRRLLEGDHGLKIAVVENEFGDTGGLESVIAGDGGGRTLNLDGSIVELRNGCVCCSVKDELVTTLEGLVEAKRGDLDAVVVELSGVANPGPVAAAFWLDAALESSVALDAIARAAKGCEGGQLARLPFRSFSTRFG